MNRLNPKQRKLAYFGCILVLVIPMIWLGMPAGSDKDSGGKLARLRQEHDLGESNFGEVDPSSATMNLVLIGLRGVAANLLWMDANKQQEQKNWSQLRADVNSIILLQPHYVTVWRFQGWNLSYNVAPEWDAVEDRYYWVKEGAKFLVNGSQRNRKHPRLYYDVGVILGEKIGNADEWRQYREFFNKQDPDVKKYEGRPDTELNPEQRDHYLVSKDWYEKANRADEDYQQRRLSRPLFRIKAALSLLHYPEIRQKEGEFGDEIRRDWQDAFEYLTGTFGRYEFTRNSSVGSIFIEMSDDEIEALAEEHDDIDENKIRKVLDFLKKECNYVYWRDRSRIESTREMDAAHKDLYDAKQMFKDGLLDRRGPNGELPSPAQAQFEKGLKRYEKLLKKYPELLKHDNVFEEILMAQIYWRHIIQNINRRQAPADFPLRYVWVNEQGRVSDMMKQFRREIAER